MRPTMILHAHPHTFDVLARECRRFTGTRSGFVERFAAAWLVFTGRADALSFEEWEALKQLEAERRKHANY